MQAFRLHRRRRSSLIAILLVALLSRGLIPAGYMPGSGGAFGLQLCDAAVPGHHLSQDTDRHPGRAPHVEHCVFSSAPLAGPAPHSVIVLAPPALNSTPTLAPEPLRVSTRLVRAQQPRAPPLPV